MPTQWPSKANLGLATSRDDTYIIVGSGLIRDVGAGRTDSMRNLVQPVMDGDALQVTSYQSDVTPPAMISFDILDINAGILQISAGRASLNKCYS